MMEQTIGWIVVSLVAAVLVTERVEQQRHVDGGGALPRLPE